ncbi:hypothetical protein [Aestuariivirga sp.]|uniref:hypothetical protein n=1 Tax=Aestuariivirga sp. TaxID=2650926 RepID=UPI00391D03E2
MKRALIAAGFVLTALSLPAHAAAPKFTGTCPTGITVKSNGSGTVKINGKKAKVKTLSANAWEASANGVRIDIARDAGGLMLSYTGKGGANGICEVTSASAGGAASASAAGTPSQDEQACLAATSRETNNGDVSVLSTETSEANNTVYIGVGPQRAKWKCLVKNGKVAEVESMGN